MPGIQPPHPSKSSDIQLEFVERGETPRELMRLSIHLHLAGLSLLRIMFMS